MIDFFSDGFSLKNKEFFRKFWPGHQGDDAYVLIMKIFVKIESGGVSDVAETMKGRVKIVK